MARCYREGRTYDLVADADLAGAAQSVQVATARVARDTGAVVQLAVIPTGDTAASVELSPDDAVRVAREALGDSGAEVQSKPKLVLLRGAVLYEVPLHSRTKGAHIIVVDAHSGAVVRDEPACLGPPLSELRKSQEPRTEAEPVEATSSTARPGAIGVAAGLVVAILALLALAARRRPSA